MNRAIRIRIILFTVLSAIGIGYIAATYLGVVDRVLGRGITVTATLPTSGGLYEGSDVTYRGINVGEVTKMETIDEGVELTLELEDGTELPKSAPMYVHNLSAIGEQYLDFEPTSDDGPYAENGDVLTGSQESLPTDEADLLVSLDAFVNSVDQQNLQVLIKELGDTFEGTGVPLQRLIDSGGQFVDTAAANTDETIALLESGETVLSTQQAQGENIRSFSRDLNLLTTALRRSDRDLRGVLANTPATAIEVRRLMEDLEPTLPVLLQNAISVNQIAVSHLDGLEHLLVVFPRTIAGGFTGSPPDGFGHVNLQFDSSVAPCTQGYLRPVQWRDPLDLRDGEIFPAQCRSPEPFVMRGPKYSPGTPLNPGRTPPGTYDPVSGRPAPSVDPLGQPVRYNRTPDLTIMGDDAWKYLLAGPVAAR